MPMSSSRRGERESMSRVDTAWLRMEAPTNRMMITGVMTFTTPLALDELKQVIGQRFLSFRRFRQKAVDRPAGAYWEDDEDFDLDWHVRVTALPGKGRKAELQSLTSQLASSPLDQARPLWQFHLVERYGAGSALITRLHHCYADGMALVQVMLSLTDVEAQPLKKVELERAWLKRDRGTVTERLLQPARAGLRQASYLGGRMLSRGRELIEDPGKLEQLAQGGGEVLRELAVALSLSDDPKTRLKGTLGATKRVAWAEPLPLGEVKTLSHALGCTVNDVLLAAASGALRSWLLEQGGDIDGLTIRATVPVNLRPLEHARQLGNHFGLVFLDLPIGEPNPLRRVERVAECMQGLKRSKQAAVTFGLLAAVGMAPAPVQRLALELFSRKASAVATNVPGPQAPMYLAGCRIDDLMFWVPQNGSIGVGISILSYNGRVHFGLIADARRIPDPQSVIDRFAPEFEKMLLIALMEDWTAPITAADADATLARHATAVRRTSEKVQKTRGARVHRRKSVV